MLISFEPITQSSNGFQFIYQLSELHHINLVLMPSVVKVI